MNRVALVLQGEESQPGLVVDRLTASGFAPYELRAALGAPMPDIDDPDLAGTVIFGGPMSANDEHLPQIQAQLAWLDKALHHDVPVFGICLGGQLLARALGGSVGAHVDGMTEVGFVDIKATPDSPEATGPFSADMPVFQWHREGFTMPATAKRLMTGEVYENQAYQHGKHQFGVQFHPEMQSHILARWHALAPECFDWKGAQTADSHVAGIARHMPSMTRWMDDFIAHWLGKPLS